MADRNVFDKQRLREFKSSSRSIEEVKAKFEWAKSRQLIRLGGFYTTPTGTRALQHFQQCSLVMNENEEGLMELTFALRDEKSRRLAEMQNNMFLATPPLLYDIHVDTGGTKIKIKLSKSDVVLDLWSKRLTLEQLEKALREDWERWRRFRDERAKKNPSFRTYQEFYDAKDPSPQVRFMGGQPDLLSADSVLPSESEGEQYRDSVIQATMEYASSYLMQDGGYINILDCKNLVTHERGLKQEVRNGVAVGPFGWGFGCSILRAGEGKA
jgi:hypothetical protein